MKDLNIMDDLFKKWGTDKNTLHSYLEAYENLFGPKRNEPIRLLEIGVWSGASIMVWSEYFTHPDTKILGVDIIPDRITCPVEGPRAIIKILDATTQNGVNQIQGNFDFIIDDGPHTLSTMIEFIRKYLPIVKKGGYLIIEDVQDIYWCDILRNEIPSEYKENISWAINI